MAAVALGLLSGIAWGFADFLGGLQSRRLPLLTVVLGSQVVGFLLVGSIVVARGEGPPSGEFFLFAALSGAAGAAGLTAFYRGLAVGAMGIVAPISATAAAIPVSVGVATGDRPSLVQGVGIALAIGGVTLASREAGDEAGRSRAVAAGVGLALVAALGFGLFFVTMDVASDDGVLWAALVSRAASVGLLALAWLLVRPRAELEGADAGKLAAVGLLDISANLSFAAASTQGLVSVVAVLGSLYPVVTVVLARAVLHERIGTVQRAGALGALAGVLLISAG